MEVWICIFPKLWLFFWLLVERILVGFYEVQNFINVGLVELALEAQDAREAAELVAAAVLVEGAEILEGIGEGLPLEGLFLAIPQVPKWLN